MNAQNTDFSPKFWKKGPFSRKTDLKRTHFGKKVRKRTQVRKNGPEWLPCLPLPLTFFTHPKKISTTLFNLKKTIYNAPNKW